MTSKNRTTANRSTGVAQTREELVRGMGMLPPTLGAIPTQASVEHAPADKLIEEIEAVRDMKILDGVQAPQPPVEATQENIGKGSDSRLSSPEHGFNIEIDKLKSHKWNARVHRTLSRIRDLALLIAADGQKYPVIVTEDPKEPGTFYIIDGETRYQAALSLNLEKLWVLAVDVDPYNPLTFYGRSLGYTNSTEPISVIDRAIRWQNLIGEKLATVEQLSSEVGTNTSTIYKMLVYSQFDPIILEFMSEHLDKFTYTLVQDLKGFIKDKSVDEILTLCKLIVAEDISRRGLADIIKRLSPKDSAKRSYKRKQAEINIPIKNGNTAIGGFRTFDNGGVEFKIQPEVEIDENLRTHLISCLEILAEAVCKGNIEEMKLSILKKLNEPK